LSDSVKAGELVVVGTGITLVSQATIEALECMKRADRLLFLVTEPATETWLRRLNPAAETLRNCYAPGKPRDRSYREMVQRILAAVQTGAYVCAAFYGHPGVFVNPGHAAIRRARREGFRARMLPGISTEDCLFADLGVDPGDEGCQSFEATSFLAYRRRFDPTSALILWQVGVLGEPSIRKDMQGRPERLRRLTTYLRRSYAARHPVVLYEAAQFPISKPRIQRIALANLPITTVWPITTLYIPPTPSRPPDPAVMRWFDED
jgi:precorrin-2 methylase